MQKKNTNEAHKHTLSWSNSPSDEGRRENFSIPQTASTTFYLICKAPPV